VRFRPNCKQECLRRWIQNLGRPRSCLQGLAISPFPSATDQSEIAPLWAQLPIAGQGYTKGEREKKKGGRWEAVWIWGSLPHIYIYIYIYMLLLLTSIDKPSTITKNHTCMSKTSRMAVIGKAGICAKGGPKHCMPDLSHANRAFSLQACAALVFLCCNLQPFISHSTYLLGCKSLGVYRLSVASSHTQRCYRGR